MIAQVPASREIDPSGGFVQLPIAQLSEAVIVARTMMVDGNLQATDRWIELMSELDRYHDLARAQAPRRRRRLGSPRRSPARSSRIRLAQMSKGNFPPRNPLKSPKTAKESRSRRAGPRRSRREIFRPATP